MATIVAAAGGGDWPTGASWVGTVAPTAADNAQVPVTAGNMVITSGSLARSADFSTYTGQLSGTSTLTVGDGTAGVSSIAVLLVAGMTVTGPPNFTFASTSATLQTVDFAAKTTGTVNFNPASNGNWQMTGGHTTAGTFTLSRGTLDVNGQTCSWGIFSSSNASTRSLTLGAAAITITTASTTAWDATTATNMTLSAASSTITFNGNSQIMNQGGSKTFGTVNFTGSGNARVGAIATFGTLSRTGTALKTDQFIISTNQTVTSALSLNGDSTTNRLLVNNNTIGTAVTITNTAVTPTMSNVDIRDVTLSNSFDASGITGLSGDAGGNSGITFTTPATQTATGTGSFSWSTHGWTSRVPLPQDNVVINNAFIAGRTVTTDMPRIGKDLNWTGTTGNPTWSLSTNVTMYGSLTMIAGVTGPASNSIIFQGRSTHTITSAGKSFPSGVNIQAPGGTYSLSDAYTNTGGFTLNNGTFNTAGFSLTVQTFNSSVTTTRALTLGSTTCSLTSTSLATVWDLATSTGMTLSAASSTIAITSVSANIRTFSGGGLSYGTLSYTVAASSGGIDIVGANTFVNVNVSDASGARALRFTAATTTTITGSFDGVRGSVAGNISLSSITAATHTLSKASGIVSCDYLTITNSIATGGATWYAGSHSIDGGGNTGWIFTDPPTAGGGGKGGGGMQGRQNLQSLQNIQ